MVSVANPSAQQPQELPAAATPSAAPAYGVPLRELLLLPGLRGTEVLAGAAGLGRPTSGVNVMEVPDVLDWVKAGELLVTTGYPITAGARDPGEALTGLVRALHERGLAGLGVKLGRYLDALPAAALELADELGMPVLALPAPLAWDDLIEQVLGRLGRRRAHAAERADTLHTSLSQLVLEGADVDQIAAEVARVLDVGVLVTSTDGRERGGALTAEHRALLEGADLVEPSGRVRVERLAVRTMVLPGGGEARVLTVAAGGSDLARIVSLSADRGLSDDDVHALERTAIVVALLLTRQQAVAVVENKYRGDFLRDVFLGRAGDEAFVVEHAQTFGWDLDRPVVVVAAEVDPLDDGEPPVSGRTRRAWQERFAAAWRQVCAGVDRSIPSVDFSTEVVSLVPVPADEQALRPAVDALVAAVAGDRGGGRRPFSVGVSRVVRELADLPAAYDQARRATLVGRRITGGRATTWFDDLGVHRLIALVPDTGELRRFAHDVLGELAEDTPEALDLRTTLQVLLDTNLNVAEAARLQFFHYNTMRYRVSKLERLLGPFTTDPHLRLNVAVALQVLDLRR